VGWVSWLGITLGDHFGFVSHPLTKKKIKDQKIYASSLANYIDIDEAIAIQT